MYALPTNLSLSLSSPLYPFSIAASLSLFFPPRSLSPSLARSRTNPNPLLPWSYYHARAPRTASSTRTDNGLAALEMNSNRAEFKSPPWRSRVRAVRILAHLHTRNANESYRYVPGKISSVRFFILRFYPFSHRSCVADEQSTAARDLFFFFRKKLLPTIRSGIDPIRLITSFIYSVAIYWEWFRWLESWLSWFWTQRLWTPREEMENVCRKVKWTLGEWSVFVKRSTESLRRLILSV